MNSIVRDCPQVAPAQAPEDTVKVEKGRHDRIARERESVSWGSVANAKWYRYR